MSDDGDLPVGDIEIVESVIVPETTLDACEDAAERWAAMTLHHIALDAVPLLEPSRVAWLFGGKVYVHPTTRALLERDA